MTEPAYTCGVCGFDVWHPVVELGSSTLGLYDDHRFPGRCLLVWHRHVEDLDELDDGELQVFVAELRACGRAVKEATGAVRVNYAVLGNAQPHLHAHIVPRLAGGDPVPRQAPWQHPEARRPLSAGEAARLAAEIRDRVRHQARR